MGLKSFDTQILLISWAMLSDGKKMWDKPLHNGTKGVPSRSSCTSLFCDHFPAIPLSLKPPKSALCAIPHNAYHRVVD